MAFSIDGVSHNPAHSLFELGNMQCLITRKFEQPREFFSIIPKEDEFSVDVVDCAMPNAKVPKTTIAAFGWSFQILSSPPGHLM
jgi:hypothetical protein